MLIDLLRSEYNYIFCVLVGMCLCSIGVSIFLLCRHRKDECQLSKIDHRVGAMRRESELMKDFLLIAVSDTLVDIFEVNLDTFQYVYLEQTKDLTVRNMSATLDLEELLNKLIPKIHPIDRANVLDTVSKKVMAEYSVGTVKKVRYRMAYNIRTYSNAVKGKYYWYTSTVRVWERDGQRYAVVSTIDETAAITEERKKQELLEDALRNAKKAGQAKATFLFNMSHDIRTPMNAVLGFTNIALKHLDDKEKVEDCLNKIESSGDHLLQLINDILEMSSIEYGKTNIEVAPCNLRQKVERIAAIFQTQMEERHITFEYGCKVLDEAVLCDQLRLDQVLMNLLGNAMKFTPEGGKVTFYVNQCGKVDDGRTIYEWKIKDTGIGMDTEFQKVMFDPFERERSSTDSGIQGTGLGLSIANSLVRLMGGAISVQSEKGVGTEFVLTFPFETMKQGYKEQSFIRSEYDFFGKRVLLVEDNLLNSEIAQELLEDEGFKVETAENGKVAVEMINVHPSRYYDLVLMDIQMPVMDGYEATKTIRKFADQAKAGIPIIAMTANAFEEDKKKAIESGMQAHVPKPIDVNQLFETAHMYLR